MTRKITVIVALVLLASLLLTSPADAAKSYYAERFDVHIDVQDNGSAIVTETVEFYFSGDPFTFAFREVSANNTDGVTFLDASMDGNLMPRGTGAGQVEVEEGNPLKVTWHFPPTSDASRVFTVRYRVSGLIRKADGDTLIWRAIPEDHDYSIDQVTVALTYPPSVTLLEQPTLDTSADVTREDGRVVLTTSGIDDDQAVILTARFPLNTLTSAPPQWQLREERADAAAARALPFGLGAGAATLLLGGLALFTYARAQSRELTISPVVPTANPPSDAAPAVVGKLTGQHHTFMGTIFDLAQRGVLEIQEDKGVWNTTSFVLQRNESNASLRPHERGLLNALFKPNETQINMSEVGTRLGMQSSLYDEPLEEDLIQRGWLDPKRKHRRTQLLVAGFLVLFLSLAVFMASLLFGGVRAAENADLLVILAIVLGVSAGAFILAIALLVYGSTYSILTPSGEEHAARWKGFAEYLKQVSRGKEPAIRPDYFEKYLAYAAVFGLGAGWAKYFQQLGGVPLPMWFHARAGSPADFAVMVAVMSASDSAGAGGAGGAGAAGASGGGSSGAG